MSNLIGRDAELAQLEALIRSQNMRGRVLVIQGEAGVGKTALLEHAATSARAQGIHLMSCCGVRSESDLPFSGLHELLHDRVDDLDRLPPRYRDALAGALGLRDVGDVLPGAVANALVQLLSDLQVTAPVAVLADDFQWIDQATAETLVYAARRAAGKALTILFAVREEEEGDAWTALDRCGFARMGVRALRQDDAEKVLASSYPELSDRLRTTVLEHSQGNPLALVELPRTLAFGDQGENPGKRSPFALRSPQVTKRLEHSFLARSDQLSAGARAVLQVASAGEGDQLDEMLGAAAVLEGGTITLRDVAETVDAGLARFDSVNKVLSFRHPLVRSALYNGMPLDQRIRVHLALAAAVQDADRRAWHKAAGCAGSDDDVAEELAQVAGRALARGALHTASVAFERAAELCSYDVRRADLLLQAAAVESDKGDQDNCARLLDAAEPLTRTDVERLRLIWLRETTVTANETGADHVMSFVAVIERLVDDGAVDSAVEFLVLISMRCFWSRLSPELEEKLARLAISVDDDDGDPRMLFVLSQIAPGRFGPTVVKRAETLVVASLTHVQNFMVGTALSAVGDPFRAEAHLMSAVGGLRAMTHNGMLVEALVGLAWNSVLTGRYATGSSAADEAIELSPEAGTPRYLAVAQLARAVFAAWSSEVELCAKLVKQGETGLVASGGSTLLALAQLAKGAQLLATGQPGAAAAQLRRIGDPEDETYQPHVWAWSLADLTDAIIRSGEPAAREGVVSVARRVAEVDVPLNQVMSRYALAFLSGQDMGGVFAGWPVLRGRAALSEGIVLRRGRSRAAARDRFNIALDLFEGTELDAWTAQVRNEMRACGARARVQNDQAVLSLTEHERQVAELAASGLSNKQIADRLFLSPRTVSTHLYHIYPKLGVASRAQLRDALG